MEPDCTRRKGQLVGYPEDEIPTLIQLESEHDTLEFWIQQEALEQLRTQLLEAISDHVPSFPIRQPLPERQVPPSATKSSLFNRRQNKAPEGKAPSKTVKLPVTVDAQLDDVHFRTETKFGLYETLRGRGVLVTVEVR